MTILARTERPRPVSPDSYKSIVTVEPPPPLLKRIASYRSLIICLVAVLVLDQGSKAWIRHHLPFPTYGGPNTIQVIPGFFDIVHVGNTGAAWSMLSGHSGLLAAVAALTLAAIYTWRKALSLKTPLVQVSFGLMCGGIAGNLIDRVLFGYVVDFLDFHFGTFIYPTFNFADSGICIGVALYLWHSLKPELTGHR